MATDQKYNILSRVKELDAGFGWVIGFFGNQESYKQMENKREIQNGKKREIK
jgi:hypothetical protein